MQTSSPLPLQTPSTTRPRRTLLRRALGAILLGAAIGALVGLVVRATRTALAPTAVTDAELALAYHVDENAAAAETKGKRATIVGHVSSVGADESGQTCVKLARDHVMAVVRAEQRHKTNDLVEGTPITMTCRIEGRDSKADRVIARDCTIDAVTR